MKQQWYKGCRLTYINGRWTVFGKGCDSLELAKERVDNAWSYLRKSLKK